jgi:LuxR family transcriptional regulator, maltose regulon positive regulatory protein
MDGNAPTQQTRRATRELQAAMARDWPPELAAKLTAVVSSRPETTTTQATAAAQEADGAALAGSRPGDHELTAAGDGGLHRPESARPRLAELRALIREMHEARVRLSELRARTATLREVRAETEKDLAATLNQLAAEHRNLTQRLASGGEPAAGRTASGQEHVSGGALTALEPDHDGRPGNGSAPEPEVPEPGPTLDVLLETKLHPPAVRADSVQRSRLVGRLSRTTGRLILVDAPAGFGKTTLVAQWRASVGQDRPFAWISLDRADNDPVRLCRNLVSALQRACPGLTDSGIAWPWRLDEKELTESVLPRLVNRLAALGTPVLLVLDDYHLIRERSCHTQIDFLARHLPPPAQLVLITRADPPLPLARLRAAGELAEIRARDLRFTRAEAAELISVAAGVQLSEPDMAELIKRTEGWPAGIYLAALSLQGHCSPSTFIREFTGNNRYIVDFLTEEVLNLLPPETRRFLMRTSILEQFSAPLCDAVTGTSTAAEILRALERANLFLVPLDDSRVWYRYNQLFGQMLRSQLARTEPGEVPALHQRASDWYRERGSAEEAVGHALAAGDTAGAIDLIARHWYELASTGRVVTVRRWLSSLGDDRIGQNPIAAHCAAWAAALCGDRETVHRWLAVMDAAQLEGPLPDGIRSLRSSAALLRATFGFDGIRVMRESAAQAVGLEDDPGTPWYAVARIMHAFALQLSGDAGAAEVIEDAVVNAPRLPMVKTVGLALASLVAADQGRLSQADEYGSAARATADASDLDDLPQTALVNTAAGAVHYQRGRLADARREFELALRSRRGLFGLSPWPAVDTLLRLAPVLIELGDRTAAEAALSELRRRLDSAPAGATALQDRLSRVERLAAGADGTTALAEPLTEREVAVLRLMRGSLSLPEIGAKLYLSPNTIKTHARAIYRKLSVANRHDAVLRGREHGLIF